MEILFKTTPEQVAFLADIVAEMKGAKPPLAFIEAAAFLAATDQGVYDLMGLWFGDTDPAEREAVVAEIVASMKELT